MTLLAELEVAHLWARPKTPSAHWFFMNRYFAFFTNLVVLVLANVTLENDVRVSRSSVIPIILTSSIYRRQYRVVFY
jgi:hypothetical protein